MLRGRGLAAAVLAACALALVACAGASAAANPFAEYAMLAQQERSPAPLVPVVMPAILGGAEATPASVLLGSGGAYSLTFSHFVAAGRQQRVDASVLLQDVGPGRTVAGRREFFGGLYRYRNTRVRGHRGLLLRARYSPVRSLVWREQGRLYELSTNTPGKISTGALRAIAAGLQHLRGAYTGQAVGAGGGVQAQALLGDRAVNLSVSWTAPCTGAGGQAAPVRGATAKVGWLALGAGGAYGRAPVAVAPQGPGAPWSLSVSGSVAVVGGQGTFQASSSAATESCGIGPLALQLARLPRLRRGT